MQSCGSSMMSNIKEELSRKVSQCEEKRALRNIANRLENRINEFKKYPLPPELKTTIDGPTKTWNVYKKQQDAIDFAFNKTKDAMVFSYEERIPDSNGRRLYLATHPKHMWTIHKFRPPQERCTYEVIVSGMPSKLYFDIEYDKTKNPNKCGNDCVKFFINIIIKELKFHFNISCNFSDIIWLDSSSEKKYSCHLIFNSQNLIFQNNLEVGKFVHHLCENIIWASTKGMSFTSCSSHFNIDQIGQLLVKNKDEKITLICDQGVYTKNRNFRLYLSTKYGKNVPLKISDQNQYDIKADDPNSEEEFFFFSLVSYLYKNNPTNLLKFEITDEHHSEQLKIKLNTFEQKVKDALDGYQSSPFPEIDAFILGLISSSASHPTGLIRRWTYFPSIELLIYDIVGYRYCENIGRHHHSNNIMILADIRHGSYYQKCHDPDCRAINFRSQLYSLPPEVLPSYFFSEHFDTPKPTRPSQIFNSLSEEDEQYLADAAMKLENIYST